MIKRILAIITVLLPLMANAQLSVGNWKLYPAYNNVKVYDNNILNEPFTGYRMLDTPEKVYYVSEGFLFSYDKKTEESYAYTVRNKMSDNNVKGIWYNFSDKYLFVAYETGNIDILHDDGTVVNMPDIKDAILTSKTINDVAFDNGRIYVATSFGIVIFDGKGNYVIESGIYNQNVESLAVVNGHILATSKNSLRFISVDGRINSWDNFTTVQGFWGNNIRALEGNRFISRNSNSSVGYCLRSWEINFETAKTSNGKWIPTTGTIVGNYATPMADGRYFANVDGTLYVINKDATTETYTIPSSISSNVIVMCESPSSLWVAGSEGIAQFDITTTPETLKNDYAKFESLPIKEASILKYSPSGRLYMSGLFPSAVFNRSNFWLEQNTHIYDGNDFINANAVGVSLDYRKGGNPAYEIITWGGAEDYNIIWSLYDVTEDPADPDTYYACCQFEGLYKLTRSSDGSYKEATHYTSSNSSMVKGYGYMVLGSTFDNNNNLWVISNSTPGSTGSSKLSFLPAAACRKASTTVSDWTGIIIPEIKLDKDAKIMACRKSNMIFILDGDWPTKIVAYDTKGTSSLSDDDYFVWNQLIDQDGKTFKQDRIISMVEDKNGKVWIGTQSGILEISNPTNATNPAMTFNRLKVPRNDGSGFADYLLDGQQVVYLSVDGANRKWAATLSSGVYYISENGDEVIEHYTTENSPLPSNTVHSVACNPINNSVFISTVNGTVEYSSTAAPAADNYDNVYAYPNPVRPDYTGWITISGLMDGSRVKIADATGNVLFDTVSEGGMVTWDGCNADGQRVRTGVYYVFASKGSSDGMSDTQGAVTKILVVN